MGSIILMFIIVRNGLPGSSGRRSKLTIIGARDCLQRKACLYGSSGGNDGTFWDHHDPVSNVIVVGVYVARFAFGRYHNTVSDTDVFVYNGLFNNAMSSYAQRGKVRLGLRILVLVKIRAHQNRIADCRPSCDHAPKTDDRPLDIRVGNNTAVGNDCAVNLRPVYFTGRQN